MYNYIKSVTPSYCSLHQLENIGCWSREQVGNCDVTVIFDPPHLCLFAFSFGYFKCN